MARQRKPRVELVAPEGYFYIHRPLRCIARSLTCTERQAKQWELLPEEEALALERNWFKQAEEETSHAPSPQPSL